MNSLTVLNDVSVNKSLNLDGSGTFNSVYLY